MSEPKKSITTLLKEIKERKPIVVPPVEPPVETAVVKKELNPTWTDALRKLRKLREDIIAQYVGQKGYDPFAWIRLNITPLETRFYQGERSELLLHEMMKLEIKPPVIGTHE